MKGYAEVSKAAERCSPRIANQTCCLVNREEEIVTYPILKVAIVVADMTSPEDCVGVDTLAARSRCEQVIIPVEHHVHVRTGKQASDGVNLKRAADGSGGQRGVEIERSRLGRADAEQNQAKSRESAHSVCLGR